MTKAKISEYDAVASNNTDVNGVNIAEGCPPSGMNNMGREIMAALKRFQVGSDGDGVTVGGNLVVSGSSTLATTAISSADINAGTIDGTAIGGSTPAAGSFTTLNTSGAVVFNDAGADVDFRVEGDTEPNLLFVDAGNDRVGIGTSAPQNKLHVSQSLAGSASSSNGIARIANTRTNTGDGAATLLFVTDEVDGSTQDKRAQIGAEYDGSNGGRLVLSTAQTSTKTMTERARITSGGYFKASETGVYNGVASNYHEIRQSLGNDAALIITHAAASQPYGIALTFTGAAPDNNTQYFFACSDTSALRMIVYSDGDLQNHDNSYGGISDAKLKQDIVDASSQWDDIKSLRVRKFKFKSDVAEQGNDASYRLGLIAQEAETVSPGLVKESPDFEEVEVPVLDDEGNPVLDEEGNPQVTTERRETGTVTKGVKYSVLYMKAVKALQEAMERIETLEASNTALEARIAALEA